MDIRHNANNRTLSCRKLIDSIHNILQWKYINFNQDRIKNKERRVFGPFSCILGLSSELELIWSLCFSNDATREVATTKLLGRLDRPVCQVERLG